MPETQDKDQNLDVKHYIKKEEVTQVNNLSLYLMALKQAERNGKDQRIK